MFLLTKFPREFCVDGKRVALIHNINEMHMLINSYNGKKNLYTSVYPFEVTFGKQGVYETAIIDKVVFDFDYDDENPEKCHLDAIKLAEWCMSKDLMFSVNFSGRGFHLFIYVRVEYLTNKKVATREFQSRIIHELDIEPDMKLVGNTAAEIRIVNTVNTRSGLYCVPLTKDLLYKDRKEIMDYAKTKHQLTDEMLIGNKLVTLKLFDTEVTYGSDKGDETKNNFDDGIFTANAEKVIQKLNDIPCMNEIINNPLAGYNERSILLCYLKYRIPLKSAEALLKSFIDKEKWDKSMCTRRHAMNIYKAPYTPYSCASIKENGFCPLASHQKDCKYYNKLLSS